MTEAALRDAVAAGYCRLGTLGLNAGSAGNLSARWGAGMIITPTGALAESVEPGTLVETSFDGAAAGEMRPSSEWAMHAAVYRRFPAAQAVVHTHSDACVALACLRRSLPSFHYMVAGFGGSEVRCAPYATFGSRELAAHAVAALEGRTACLLANHGMICHDKDVPAAIATALRLETLSRQYLLALQVADPVLLTPAEMEDVRERYKSYGAQPRTGIG